jgi:catechol 2,3-dioxygenase-like lactoylglutathione lyase family enzyme
MFKATHPIISTRDIERAMDFYTQQLGFELAFRDKTDSPITLGFGAIRSSCTCSFSSSTR